MKEPLLEELPLFRASQLLFTYLHLSPLPQLTRGLEAIGLTAIAYETVQLADGSLPLLIPMSQIAGRLAPQVGANVLLHHAGGKGVLLSGATGVTPARVLILGGGSVGRSAAEIALGLGAEVILFDIQLSRLAALESAFQGRRLTTQYSTPAAIERHLPQADLVIGAVLVPGARAPHVIARSMLKRMSAGSVIVDVAIDQGGCVESARPTTHAAPTFEVDGILHYCVTNMPGSVPRTATWSLTQATLPYIRQLAAQGEAALAPETPLGRGVQLKHGQRIHPALH